MVHIGVIRDPDNLSIYPFSFSLYDKHGGIYEPGCRLQVLVALI
jgi:hypothetical protein